MSQVIPSRRIFGGAILLYFVIGLEILIMISPFAAYFYAAFNPVLLFLAAGPATRWLTGFFLPHMVLPPGLFLKAVRVAGSVAFVGGLVVFLGCAVQVYFHQFTRRGPVASGLYRWVRHPQYVALACTGLGLAILWPRFLTLVLWTIMVGLYALLARDEERRMVAQHGDAYRAVMARTGRFFPRAMEKAAMRLPLPRAGVSRATTGFVLFALVTVGSAFALRVFTVARLPLWSSGRVVALAILPGDGMMLEHRMREVLALPAVEARLTSHPGPVLVYLSPKQYVMQGMIADTEPRFRLYLHHGSLAMIADWIFHPFRHLQGGHMMMHHDMGGGTPGAATPGTGAPGAATPGTLRRLIFLHVDTKNDALAPGAVFALAAERTPLFFADIDIHALELQHVEDLGPGTGWGRVPTPMF
jgi:protein-S-isoprenylcysteine O-methyltransferase Ste14